ncbi:FKBP-type peptidyl-prolyl cis-trans isomerase [Lujinxingia litoralis]|nr:FKBP-type peptidyl-prolyl cis-trans isomerase [Lujinxingia litoralis]
MLRRLTVWMPLLLIFLLACDSPQPAETTDNSAEAEAPQAEETPEAEAPEAEKAPEAEAPEANEDPLAAPADVAAPPADAEVTSSGLASKVLKPGSGTTHPTATSTVKAHYTGWTTDGKMFDSSVKRGQPLTMPLDRVIAGWTEGVQLMVEGEKRRFWIPQDLAYRGAPGAPAGMLVFDVELIEIVK